MSWDASVGGASGVLARGPPAREVGGGQVGESIIPTSESKGLLVFWDASCWHSERRGRGGGGDIVGGEGVGGGEETNGVVSSPPHPPRSRPSPRSPDLLFVVVIIPHRSPCG